MVTLAWCALCLITTETAAAPAFTIARPGTIHILRNHFQGQGDHKKPIFLNFFINILSTIIMHYTAFPLLRPAGNIILHGLQMWVLLGEA